MRVSRWWYDEIRFDDAAWRRVACARSLPLRHEPGDPADGWYAVARHHATTPDPSPELDELDSLDDYLSVLQGRAHTSLDEYRVVVALCAETEVIFEWSSSADRAFDVDGVCRVPVFKAGEIPEAFRARDSPIWQTLRVVVYVTRQFRSVRLLDSRMQDGPVDPSFLDTRGLQFGDGAAAVYLEAHMSVGTYEDLPFAPYREITALHDESLDVELCLIRVFTPSVFHLEDDATWTTHLVPRHIARFFELVMV